MLGVMVMINEIREDTRRVFSQRHRVTALMPYRSLDSTGPDTGRAQCRRPLFPGGLLTRRCDVHERCSDAVLRNRMPRVARPDFSLSEPFTHACGRFGLFPKEALGSLGVAGGHFARSGGAMAVCKRRTARGRASATPQVAGILTGHLLGVQ
jgi:hypothetical protein